MTDEGSGFKEAAEKCNLYHQYDRRHFVDKIKNHWHGVQDKNKYRTTIENILDTADKNKVDQLLASAIKEYECDPKALQLIEKISSKKSSLCFAFTSDRFNHGHVSTGRAEMKNACVKGQGKLKDMLKQSTLCESIDIIARHVRKQDDDILKELGELRVQNKRVGIYYANAFDKSKMNGSYFKCVETTSTPFQYKVKECSTSSNFSLVNLRGEVHWKGTSYCIPICSCSFFRSTWIICSCICAASSRCENFDIDDLCNFIRTFWFGFIHYGKQLSILLCYRITKTHLFFAMLLPPRNRGCLLRL